MSRTPADNAPMSVTHADKPLNEMSAIEYYWYHKNHHVDNSADNKSNSSKSISYGLNPNPPKKHSKFYYFQDIRNFTHNFL